MQLTQIIIAGFVGGEMEIQNQVEGYLFRGKIERITVEDGDLKVRFEWFAKGEGFPPVPRKWVMDDRLDYATSLEICAVSNIGPSTVGSDRLSLLSEITGELAVLYPPDGSKLDTSKIEGFQPKQT